MAPCLEEELDAPFRQPQGAVARTALDIIGWLADVPGVQTSLNEPRRPFVRMYEAYIGPIDADCTFVCNYY